MTKVSFLIDFHNYKINMKPQNRYVKYEDESLNKLNLYDYYVHSKSAI